MDGWVRGVKIMDANQKKTHQHPNNFAWFINPKVQSYQSIELIRVRGQTKAADR